MRAIWTGIDQVLIWLLKGTASMAALALKAIILAFVVTISLCVVIDYAAERLTPEDSSIGYTEYDAVPVYTWRDPLGRPVAYKVDFELSLSHNVQHFCVVLTSEQFQDLEDGERPVLRKLGKGQLLLDNWALTIGKL